MNENEMVLWSVWYGALATLPLVMTKLFIKSAMARVVARRPTSSAKR